MSIDLSAGDSAPWHYWSSQSSGCTPAGAGDATPSAAGLPFSERSEDRWLSEVQVLPAARRCRRLPSTATRSPTALFLPVDTAARWTDQLEGQTDGRLVALNFGVSGDRITGQAPAGQLPPRVATDVFAPLGVSAVMVEMGSNDIKAGVSAAADPRRDPVAGRRKVAAPCTRRSSSRRFRGAATGSPPSRSSSARCSTQALRRYPIVADHRRRADRSGHRHHPRELRRRRPHPPESARASRP